MTQLASLVIVCLTLVAVVTSCSMAAVEQTRSIHAFKQFCFEGGGDWNSWTSACDRPTPSKEQ